MYQRAAGFVWEWIGHDVPDLFALIAFDEPCLVLGGNFGVEKTGGIRFHARKDSLELFGRELSFRGLTPK